MSLFRQRDNNDKGQFVETDKKQQGHLGTIKSKRNCSYIF